MDETESSRRTDVRSKGGGRIYRVGLRLQDEDGGFTVLGSSGTTESNRVVGFRSGCRTTCGRQDLFSEYPRRLSGGEKGPSGCSKGKERTEARVASSAKKNAGGQRRSCGVDGKTTTKGGSGCVFGERSGVEEGWMVKRVKYDLWALEPSEWLKADGGKRKGGNGG
jgi:hypothetical protein